jgi:glyoxylase-like metal-dependent hydrolase (beta-lactamase superfamily II)
MVGSGEIGLSEEHDAHVYLVDAGTSYFLVDAGTGIDSRRLLENIASKVSPEKPVSHLLVTHCHADHAGGVADLRQALNLHVGASAETAQRISSGDDRTLALDVARREGVYPADYRFQAVKVDEIYADGYAAELGGCRVTAFLTPGHSSDSVCYLVQLEEGAALFCGDTLFANGQLPLLNTFDSNLAAYRQSLSRLSHLSFDLLFPGHGLFLVSGAYRLVETLQSKLEGSIFLPPVLSA